MSSRREFIQTAMLAAATPFAAAGAAKAGAPTAEPAIYKAIYDERFEAARGFAAEARLKGWAPAAIQGDVTDLWYNDLALRWKKGPAAIAGVTTRESLFCLDILARDAGMRVVEQAEHCEDGLVSWVIAPPSKGRRA